MWSRRSLGGSLGEAGGQQPRGLCGVSYSHLDAAGVMVGRPPGQGQQVLRRPGGHPFAIDHGRLGWQAAGLGVRRWLRRVQQVAEPGDEDPSLHARRRREGVQFLEEGSLGVATPGDADLPPRQHLIPGEGEHRPMAIPDREAAVRGFPDEADDVADLAVVPDTTQAHSTAGLWKLAGHVSHPPL